MMEGRALKPGFLRRWASKPKLLVAGLCLAVAVIPVVWWSVHLWQTVDARLRQGPFSNTLSIYAAPQTLAVGDGIDPAQLAAELRQSGYSDSTGNPIGHYRLDRDLVDIYPGPQSYFQAEPARVHFRNGHVYEIVLNNGDGKTGRYNLEPQLMVDLNGEEREKRRFVHFDQIPKVLVNAILSAEDKHFFHHLGIDPVRMVKAAYVNLKTGRREQGGSTLTMQLARNLWLDARKNWKRKITECMITLILERKLSKKEIFEYYSNQIYLGEHETFSMHGFGEAARVYFHKDLPQLTLAEAALLAGMVQRPSYFEPLRHPERAIARRNLVLALMRQNGYITPGEEKMAASTPLGVSSTAPERGDAPYFLPLAADELQTILGPKTVADNSYRVYTTLDQRLQRAAGEAVRLGMKDVDTLLRRKGTTAANSAGPQVALVALDPHTGEVKAVVGGRNYRASQLNHALSKRQPGSVFKPFVYAAALSAKTAQQHYLFTASSIVDDAPTTFRFGPVIYQPANFADHYYGRVTLREALAKSMNSAAVSVAEEVGYGRVLDLARRSGMNDGLRATPAIALGAYEATPLEMAGAYTVFANGGAYVKPAFIAEVRSTDGKALFRETSEQHPVLDSRVAFLMRDLLQEVMRSGTGAGIHSKGFNVPAAGKTGTSRDGWFAGFTSNLICVVWVGFDDNSDLDLEGAKSALPIWTEFMKRAAQNAQYALPFEGVPSGIVSLQIDPESGDLASPQCPSTRAEYFIAGSEPQTVCALHNGTLVSAESEGEAARLEVAGKPEIGVSQQTGMACYFSPGANGGLTASGARLSGEELVAAHATYPLGSHVKVTNLANRKTIEVRIVDRFPATNRVINVSEAAAKLLDFVKAGTAEVRLELMR